MAASSSYRVSRDCSHFHFVRAFSALDDVCKRIQTNWPQTGRCGRCTGAERPIPGTLCASVVGRSCNNRNVKRNACSDGGLQSVVGVCKASRQLERRSATDASFY